MVNDYGGYKALFAHGITELGCWAHARRKFLDAHKASGSPVDKEALQHIGALKRWLDDLQLMVLGNTGLDKAVNDTLKRWSALARVADDGRYPIDNNPIEDAIRPIAPGRKNWLFAGSETAGKRATAIMSLFATDKANGIEPHTWLTDVLTRPAARDQGPGHRQPLAGERIPPLTLSPSRRATCGGRTLAVLHFRIELAKRHTTGQNA